jgi:hypothetical protein
MNKQLLFLSILIISISSCNPKKTVPNTDVDVATAFIRNVLDNDITSAQQYVLSSDTGFISVTKRGFEEMSPSELDSYKNADIIMNKITPLNDSVTIISYSNTYKRDIPQQIKMVKVNGQWLVDLKYTFINN